MTIMTPLRVLLVGAALALAPCAPAAALDYPTKTVTIVVPLAAGTGMDSVVRIYAEELQKALGKPVVVENQPGAAMMLGTTNVARAAPDGHTLVIATTSALCINPVVYKKINYDPNADLVPIAHYVKSPFILVVNPKLPINTVPELIAAAKASATPMTYSSPGAGTAQHLSMEYMKQQFGIEMTHVAYRSTPQSITDIVGGHVHAAFAEAGASLSLIQDGQLRALAVSSAERLAFLPNIAPFAEAANRPGFEAVSWHMLLAPAATPKEVVDRLHQEMKKITSAAEFKKKVSDIGLSPVDTPPVDGIKAYIKSEQEKWGSLVRKLGLEGSQ